MRLSAMMSNGKRHLDRLREPKLLHRSLEVAGLKDVRHTARRGLLCSGEEEVEGALARRGEPRGPVHVRPGGGDATQLPLMQCESGCHCGELQVVVQPDVTYALHAWPRALQCLQHSG